MCAVCFCGRRRDEIWIMDIIMERKSHGVLVVPLLRTLNFAACCVLPAACCVLFEYLSGRKFKFPLQLQPTALTALGFFTLKVPRRTTMITKEEEIICGISSLLNTSTIFFQSSFIRLRSLHFTACVKHCLFIINTS